MKRQHDSRGIHRDQIVAERRVPLDVHVLRTAGERLPQPPTTLLVRAAEPTAVLNPAAGHDHRQATVGQRPGNVHVAQAIQTQFDEIGLRSLIPRDPQRLSRLPRHRDTQLQSGHCPRS